MAFAERRFGSRPHRRYADDEPDREEVAVTRRASHRREAFVGLAACENAWMDEVTGSSAATEGILAFWAWWDGARPAIEAALDAKQLPSHIVDAMGMQTSAVDPGLAWELGPGIGTRYQVCLTAEGDIERRALTEAWRRAAPSDANWEYYAARHATRG